MNQMTRQTYTDTSAETDTTIAKDTEKKPVAPARPAADLQPANPGRVKPAPVGPDAANAGTVNKGRAPAAGVPANALSEADIARIRSALLGGEDPLARRQDLVDLHKRFVQLFETLNAGIGEMHVAKAEADRKVLSARIDGLEDAVNRMEGALRIEFEPVLRDTVRTVIAESRPAAPRRMVRRTLALAILLAAGLTLGAVFHAPLSAAAAPVVAKLETIASSIFVNLSPNGGSSDAASPVN